MKYKFLITIATPDQWKSCKKLRLTSLKGSEARFFNSSPKLIYQYESMGEKEYKEAFFGENKFTVLVWIEGEAVGMGRGCLQDDGIWHIYNLYIKPSFRRYGIGTSLLGYILGEIICRGGKKMKTFIHYKNQHSKYVFKKFGFSQASVISVFWSSFVPFQKIIK